MFTAKPTTRQHYPASTPEPSCDDVIETRLWLEEHNWLYGLLHRKDNVSVLLFFRVAPVIFG